MFRAEQRRGIRKHNERMSLAWHVAALMRTNKKFPTLDKLLLKTEQRGKPVQTMAQQIAVARMWSALGYGKIHETERPIILHGRR